MGKASKGGSSSASKDGMIDIDPVCVRFTHARIRPYFTGCGRKIEDTLADIIGGKLSVNDLPKITVILNEGTYFSLNNRRLYVLKELRSKGLLTNNTISARLKVALEREKDKYKVERCSLVAKIMRENASENNALGEECSENKGPGEECSDDGDSSDIDVEIKADRNNDNIKQPAMGLRDSAVEERNDFEIGKKIAPKGKEKKSKKEKKEEYEDKIFAKKSPTDELADGVKGLKMKKKKNNCRRNRNASSSDEES